MWSEEAREAYKLFLTFAESKLIEVIEVVKEFISEYRLYICIGLIILAILGILDLWMKWQDKREKKQIEDQIEHQMEDHIEE